MTPPVRHALLLDLLEDALDQADIRLTAAAKVRLRFAIADVADADHLELIRVERAPSCAK